MWYLRLQILSFKYPSIFHKLVFTKGFQNGRNKTESFQAKKLKKRRRPLPLQESRLLWHQPNPGQQDRINLHPDQFFNPDQPSTSSSASSECSGNETCRLKCFSRRLRHNADGHLCHHNNDNNIITMSNSNQEKILNIKTTDQMTEIEMEPNWRIMTRNRTRQLGIGGKKKVVARRMIAPGIYEILVQHD